MKNLSISVGCWMSCLLVRSFVLHDVEPGTPEWILWICFSSWIAFAVGFEFNEYRRTDRGAIMVQTYARFVAFVFLWALTIFIRGGIIEDLHPWQWQWGAWILGVTIFGALAGYEAHKIRLRKAERNGAYTTPTD